MSAAKNWCFTLNNYNDEQVEHLRRAFEEAQAVYMVFGRERGENGTPHLQGFLQLGVRRRLGQLRNTFSDQAHWEIARGTPQEAARYCKKDGDFEELGAILGGSGRRSDLGAVAELVRGGASMRRIADEHPEAVLRYGNGISRLRLYSKPAERDGPPEVRVYWGATGLGKTRRVHSECPSQDLWIHPGDRWFDGYDGQEAVLFDDFDGGWFKLGYLLKLLDRYCFQVPIKGGYAWWQPKKIFITSNVDPKLWYQGAAESQQQALQRRLREFGQVIHFDALLPNDPN